MGDRCSVTVKCQTIRGQGNEHWTNHKQPTTTTSRPVANAQWHSLCVISRGRVSPRLAITAIKSRYPSRRGCDFLDQRSYYIPLVDQLKLMLLQDTVQAKPHFCHWINKITASERRTYVLTKPQYPIAKMLPNVNTSRRPLPWMFRGHNLD